MRYPWQNATAYFNPTETKTDDPSLDLAHDLTHLRLSFPDASEHPERVNV